MGLSNELKDLHVKSFCNRPKDANPCLVIGNLYGEDSLYEDLKSFSLLSPIEFVSEKIEFFAKYEVGSEEGVLALLLEFFAKAEDEKLSEFLNELDIGYISAECSLGEEEVEELALRYKDKSPYLLICKDLENHKNAKNIAKLLSMLVCFCNFKIVYENLDKDIENNRLNIADEIEEINSFDGAVVYLNSQSDGLLGSSQFALSNRISDGDRVLVKMEDFEQQEVFRLLKTLKGTIGLLKNKNPKSAYAYQVSKIIRIDDE